MRVAKEHQALTPVLQRDEHVWLCALRRLVNHEQVNLSLALPQRVNGAGAERCAQDVRLADEAALTFLALALCRAKQLTPLPLLFPQLPLLGVPVLLQALDLCLARRHSGVDVRELAAKVTEALRLCFVARHLLADCCHRLSELVHNRIQ